jgi:hypothetical protein
MPHEIDLLRAVDPQTHLVVEKANNVVWTPEELHEAEAAGQFQQEDQIQSAEKEVAVSAPFPGCLQQAGATDDHSRYRLLGQTRHFLIFAR